jgi:preprotein translocase subunit YajC
VDLDLHAGGELDASRLGEVFAAMAALLVFMFWSSRRRAKRMKDEQEAKARAMLPGVKVLLQTFRDRVDRREEDGSPTSGSGAGLQRL